jgi:anti-anti-sigma regulatory factor
MARRRISAQRARRPGAAALVHAPGAPGRSCLRIEGAMQIREASERKVQLCAALDAGVVAIDLSGVAAIDTAGVQLLLAVAQEAARRQLPLRLLGCPAALMQAVRSLGVEGWLAPLLAEAA